MPISLTAARKPQADGKVQLPPPPPAAVPVATQQPEQQSDVKDDATAEPPAGNE